MSDFDRPGPSLRDVRALRDVGLDGDRHPAIERAAERKLQAMLSGGQTPDRRRRVRRRVGVFSGVFVLGTAAMAGGAYAVLKPEPALSQGIGCYLQDTTNGGVGAVPVDGRAAIESCTQEVWRAQQEAGAVRRIPQLQACIDPDGGNAIRVFPSDDPKVCDRNDGWVNDPDAGAGSEAFAKMDRTLRYATGKCLRRADASKVAEKALADPKLGRWKLKVDDRFGTDRPCAQFIVDSRSRTVQMIAVPVGY